MKVYVNWLEEKVVGANEFESMVATKATENMDDEVLLQEFLTDTYGIIAVYQMHDFDKVGIQSEFFSWCRDKAEAELHEDWTEYTI